MSESRITHLALLAEIDELIARVEDWIEQPSDWAPMNRARALLRRLIQRVEQLRFRVEAPLIVATFGGTGTGKSSLVNALIGLECSPVSRERPTTKRPVLILHPQIERNALGLDLEEFDILEVQADILRDIVLIDCPDPDSDEEASPDSNISRLRELLPHCDVLIYTSTQQKYRSSCVIDELGQAATGCRLIFVQTHAEWDEDIREDWSKNLEEQYEVPEMFFVDSVDALKQQQAGKKCGGDFFRLTELLTNELSRSARISIRRANLIDLVQEALEHCRTELTGGSVALEQLEAALEEQLHSLTTAMNERLHSELITTRSLWERRLLSEVTSNWGLSPFSSVLRLYNGLGNMIASMSLFRARNSAQMVLIGAMQGARWMKSRQQESQVEQQIERLPLLGWDDQLMRESQIVISGYVQAAQLDPGLLQQSNLETIRQNVSLLEDQFITNAKCRIDKMITELAMKNSRLFVRLIYESLFLVYVALVVYRIGKNFFYDTFWVPMWAELPIGQTEVLSVDFYIAAGLFLMIWSGILVMMFTRRLRRGLNKKLETIANELASSQFSTGPFSRLEAACKETTLQRQRLDALVDTTRSLRTNIACSHALGAPRIMHSKSLEK